jgi:hypothetical protein
MIIKGQKSTVGYKPYLIILSILLLPVLFLRFYSSHNSKTDRVDPEVLVFCDAEQVEGDVFISQGHKFSGAETRSDETSNSGTYSSKLMGDQKIGMSYRMDNPAPGARYKVEIWSYNQHPVKASLVAKDSGGDDFYQSVSDPIERRDDAWARWEMYFTVPRYNTPKSIDVFCTKSDGPNSIFFDDLKITYVGENDLVVIDKFIPDDFKITIDKEGLDKLEKNRKKSIAQGLVFHDDNKIKCKIWDDGQYKKATIRHKGDWLDHMGTNPSYRVDMSTEESWQGMQSFSVQEPYTRGYLWEWVFFQFLDYVDVIRPRFDFIYFKQNSKDKIVFSYEEHFTKNLVEHRSRREGPIVKMTEDRMWETTKRTIKGWRGSLPATEERDKAYWSSELRAFKESKMVKNPKLKSDFEVAQNLLLQFKYNLSSTEKIFDLDKMAKYLVMVDICLAHHAVTWHNQRFYYNPVTALLEPIGFDGYSSEEPYKYASHIYTEKLYTNQRGHMEAIDDLFYDDNFVKKYFYYLNEYTDPSFIDSFLESVEEPLVERENFIRNRYSSYKFNRDVIKKKAIRTQIALPAYENSLLAYRYQSEEGVDYLKVINQHNFPLEIITGVNDVSKGKLIYPQVRNAVPEYNQIEVVTGTTELKYKVAGLDSIHTAKILKWTTPDSWSPRQELKSNITEFQDVLVLDGDQIRMNTGEIRINKPLVIPANKLLTVNGGTHLIFSDGAFLLSYSPVRFLGDPEDPIVVESIDENSGSISVIQADGQSRLRNVLFKNQNTLSYKKWGLSGAVNFYESNVDIEHTSFTNNLCEDALNIIRSEFTMTESKFSDTFADAFDSDFCRGTVKDTHFLNIGNDAIDASGSVLSIAGCRIMSAGDKGISAGEQSTMHVTWTNVDGASIGIASKDKSKVTADHIDLKNCSLGFTAFQKKPEYGPAFIEINNYKASGVNQLYNIQEGSKIDFKLEQ